MTQTTLKPDERARDAADVSANKLEAAVALMAFVTLFFAGVVVGLWADALGMFVRHSSLLALGKKSLFCLERDKKPLGNSSLLYVCEMLEKCQAKNSHKSK